MKDYNEFNNYSSEPYAAVNEPKKKSDIGKKLVITAVCCSVFGGALGAGGTVLGMKALGGNTGAQASATTTASAQQENADAGTVKGMTENNSTESVGDGPAAGDKNVTIVNGDHGDSSSDSSGNVTITQTKADTGKLMTAAEVYKANVNSTVGIQTSITSTNYWGYQTQAAASGSGFIISADGYILTNHHVIEDADSITVKMYDGTSYDAKLIGSDESNDVAVLKIDADGLTPVVLGSSKALSVGDDVVAIGNPLGELTFSLTSGIVSALDRTITTSSSVMLDLIQTDCAINSGNSGGALFNMYGEVVGITNSKYSSNGTNEASIDNIGFAIPIDSIRSIVDSLITNGYVTKPYIGVGLADLSADALNYGLPKGAAVKKLTDNAPAANAGIEVGDIITKADGETIENSNQLISKIRKCSAGDDLKLTVYRKGDEFEVTVKVEEQKQETEAEKKEAQKKKQQEMEEQYRNYNYDYDWPFGNMFGY